jgi:hypothetical protein
VPVSPCFAIRAWRFTCSRGMRLSPSPPRRFPVPSVPILVSRGYSDWLAMPAPKRLGGSRSDCSAFLNTLPPHSVGPQRNQRFRVHLVFPRPRRSVFLRAAPFSSSPVGSSTPLPFPRSRSSVFCFCFMQDGGNPVLDNAHTPNPYAALQQPRCATRGIMNNDSAKERSSIIPPDDPTKPRNPVIPADDPTKPRNPVIPADNSTQSSNS